jgi:hypothetical protein
MKQADNGQLNSPDVCLGVSDTIFYHKNKYRTTNVSHRTIPFIAAVSELT